jgi:hypothetical protein
MFIAILASWFLALVFSLTIIPRSFRPEQFQCSEAELKLQSGEIYKLCRDASTSLLGCGYFDGKGCYCILYASAASVSMTAWVENGMHHSSSFRPELFQCSEAELKLQSGEISKPCRDASTSLLGCGYFDGKGCYCNFIRFGCFGQHDGAWIERCLHFAFGLRLF